VLESLHQYVDYCMQGTDFKVDGGLTSSYVTPIGEPLLPPPASMI
jgi:hypothetical protein